MQPEGQGNRASEHLRYATFCWVLVDVRSDPSRATAKVSRLVRSYSGNRPSFMNGGLPPMTANYAKVAGLNVIPCSIKRYSLVILRRIRVGQERAMVSVDD